MRREGAPGQEEPPKIHGEQLEFDDIAIVRSMVFLGSVLYVLGLLLTDISYTFVDPRVRLSG